MTCAAAAASHTHRHLCGNAVVSKTALLRGAPHVSPLEGAAAAVCTVFAFKTPSETLTASFCCRSEVRGALRWQTAEVDDQLHPLCLLAQRHDVMAGCTVTDRFTRRLCLLDVGNSE